MQVHSKVFLAVFLALVSVRLRRLGNAVSSAVGKPKHAVLNAKRFLRVPKMKKRAVGCWLKNTLGSGSLPRKLSAKLISTSQRRKNVQLQNLTLDEVSLTFLVLEQQMLVEDLPPHLQDLSPDQWEELAFLLSSLRQSQLTSSLH